jgi:hypothetical protein
VLTVILGVLPARALAVVLSLRGSGLRLEHSRRDRKRSFIPRFDLVQPLQVPRAAACLA